MWLEALSYGAINSLCNKSTAGYTGRMTNNDNTDQTAIFPMTMIHEIL